MEPYPPADVLIGSVGDVVFALPAASVQRVVRMAALTPFPDPPEGVVGLLNVGGVSLPVVDPRSRLGVPAVNPHADQRLILLSGRSPYVLWVDQVDRLVALGPDDIDVIVTTREHPTARLAARIDDRIIPILDPEGLDPGTVVEPARVHAGLAGGRERAGW